MGNAPTVQIWPEMRRNPVTGDGGGVWGEREERHVWRMVRAGGENWELTPSHLHGIFLSQPCGAVVPGRDARYYRGLNFCEQRERCLNSEPGTTGAHPAVLPRPP